MLISLVAKSVMFCLEILHFDWFVNLVLEGALVESCMLLGLAATFVLL